VATLSLNDQVVGLLNPAEMWLMQCISRLPASRNSGKLCPIDSFNALGNCGPEKWAAAAFHNWRIWDEIKSNFLFPDLSTMQPQPKCRQRSPSRIRIRIQIRVPKGQSRSHKPQCAVYQHFKLINALGTAKGGGVAVVGGGRFGGVAATSNVRSDLWAVEENEIITWHAAQGG